MCIHFSIAGVTPSFRGFEVCVSFSPLRKSQRRLQFMVGSGSPALAKNALIAKMWDWTVAADLPNQPRYPANKRTSRAHSRRSSSVDMGR